MKETTELQVATKARGGRPRVSDRHAPVSTWLPTDTYEQLLALAKRRETSLSATVRALLIFRLR
jgi:hypothetical protein